MTITEAQKLVSQFASGYQALLTPRDIGGVEVELDGTFDAVQLHRIADTMERTE